MASKQTTAADGVESAEPTTDATETPRQRSYGVNRWTLLGRMTADPELRYTTSGKSVLNFGVATSGGGYTHFHDVVAWERSAEILAQYGRKGREVYLEGRLTPKVRELDGRRVKQVELVVESFQLIGNNNSSPPANGEA